MKIQHAGLVMLSVTVLNIACMTSQSVSANSVKHKIIKQHKKPKKSKKVTHKHKNSSVKKHVTWKSANKPIFLPNPIFAKSDGKSYPIGEYTDVNFTTGTESNSFVIPKEYAQAVKKLCETDSNKYIAKIERYLKQHPEIVRQSYQFVAKPSDVHKYVDVYNMSEKDKRELNDFCYNIINHMRKQFGTKMISTAPLSDKFANDIAKKYDYDKWNTLDGHDLKAVNNTAKEWGLDYNHSYSSQYYEDTSVWVGAIGVDRLKHISMAELKAYMYFNFGTMMFEDGGKERWGHACHLSGYWVQDNTKRIFGSVKIDKMTNVHYVMVEDGMVKKKGLKTKFYNSHYR